MYIKLSEFILCFQLLLIYNYYEEGDCMKIKIYTQKSVIMFILLIFFGSINVAAIYGLVYSIIEMCEKITLENCVLLVCTLIISSVFTYTSIKMARNKIVYYKDRIFVHEHWGSTRSKIQYEVTIKFEEITDIILEASILSSKNTHLFSAAPMPYLVFMCGDEEKLINLFYYSKKQTIDMIDLAVECARRCGNNLEVKPGAELLKDFLKIFEKKIK